jgi:hypothetical protein
MKATRKWSGLGKWVWMDSISVRIVTQNSLFDRRAQLRGALKCDAVVTYFFGMANDNERSLFFTPAGAPTDRDQKRYLTMICLLILVTTETPKRVCGCVYWQKPGNEPTSTNCCSCIGLFTHPNFRRMLLSRGNILSAGTWNWLSLALESISCVMFEFRV